MRWQAVPDQDHPTLLESVHVVQELDEGLVVVGTRTQLENEVSIAAIRFVDEGTGYREPFQPNRWRSTGVWPPGAQVARTAGSSDTPDSSSTMISACWRLALFLCAATAA